jgi:hypothetical protein
VILRLEKVSREEDGDLINYSEDEFQSILMALITADADVHSIDNEGITPSDLAHCYDHLDVWIQVLAACGYNPREVFDVEYNPLRQYTGMKTFFAGEVSIRPTKLSFKEYYAIQQSTGCDGRASYHTDRGPTQCAKIQAIYGDSGESSDGESSRSDCEECEYREFSDWDDGDTEDDASVCQDDDYESIDGDPTWRAYIPRHRFLWYWIEVGTSEDTDSDLFDSCDEGD